MAIPTNIEALLSKSKIESERIEFKKGWNPSSIYHTICAFANDIDNLGGGYILVGVEEQNGIALRPVCGIRPEKIDSILKEMNGFNNKFNPYYLPRTSVELVDGVNVLAIWVPSGVNRPYDIPTDVTVKEKCPRAFYVRSGSSSIAAKGEVLDFLRDMANRTPFDERGNENISIDDISSILVYEYLRKVNSKLLKSFEPTTLLSTLEQMDLLDGPTERRTIKNVAAMMFSEHPQKFFPVSKVDVVIFPEGRIKNPDNMQELPSIEGPVPKMIEETLNSLKTNVIKECIKKQKDDEHSLRYFNYPYQALEEAVVNALYHRDYREREPVEITVEPDKITILSYSGPDRSISRDSIKAADSLHSRRYRNRRLGEFLKELGLTEGRATGIPTIQKELALNGSGRATISTDDDRTYFMIEIPCHPEFNQQISEVVAIDKQSLISRLTKMGFEPKYVDGVAQILLFVAQARSLNEIMSLMKQTNKNRFRNNYIRPLLSSGLMRMTNPENSKSKGQKYILSEEAQRILTQ